MKRVLGSLVASLVVLALFYRVLAPAYLQVERELRQYVPDGAAGSTMLDTLQTTVLLWGPLVLLVGGITMVFVAGLRRRGTSRRTRRP